MSKKGIIQELEEDIEKLDQAIIAEDDKINRLYLQIRIAENALSEEERKVEAASSCEATAKGVFVAACLEKEKIEEEERSLFKKINGIEQDIVMLAASMVATEVEVQNILYAEEPQESDAEKKNNLK